MDINYWDGGGPLLPEGTPEFGAPGTFNRWYAVGQAEMVVHNARVALEAAERTLKIEREKAEQE